MGNMGWEHLHRIFMRPGGDFAYFLFTICNLNLWTTRWPQLYYQRESIFNPLRCNWIWRHVAKIIRIQIQPLLDVVCCWFSSDCTFMVKGHYWGASHPYPQCNICCASFIPTHNVIAVVLHLKKKRSKIRKGMHH